MIHQEAAALRGLGANAWWSQPSGDPDEQNGVTTMTVLLVYKDQASRDAGTRTAADGVHAADGMQGSYDNLEDYLITLA